MLLEILDTNGEPLQNASFGAIDRGADSSTIAFDVWCRRGEAGGAPLEDLAFALLTEDPGQPGRGLARGTPPQDELWPRARVAGHDAGADPAQAPQVTDWTPLGAYRVLPLRPIHVGCARRLEVKIHPPSTATPGVSWRWYPVVFAGERSRALPAPPIATGILYPVESRGPAVLLRGGDVTPSDPPDQRLHVAMRQSAEHGRLRGAPAVELAFDLDAADRALDAGEHYWAVLTNGADGVTVTKLERRRHRKRRRDRARRLGRRRLDLLRSRGAAPHRGRPAAAHHLRRRRAGRGRVDPRALEPTPWPSRDGPSGRATDGRRSASVGLSPASVPLTVYRPNERPIPCKLKRPSHSSR